MDAQRRPAQLRELHQRTTDLLRLKPGGSGTGDMVPEGTYVPLEPRRPRGLNTAVADYTLGFVTEGTYAYGWFCPGWRRIRRAQRVEVRVMA